MTFHDFHFLRPWWLLALPLGLVLLSGLRQQKRGQSQWHKICDQHLLGHLLVGESETRSKSIYGFFMLMLLLATLALAGPAWERRPQPLFRSAAGRVIVLDLSLSMQATDLPPNRLSRARYKAIDLVKAVVGIDQGLVVFAGDSFIVTPLTDDRAMILNLLPSLDINTVPVQGSRADRGLEKAGELLRRAAVSRGQIILIADDADEAAVKVVAKLKKAGYRTDVIAVGSKEGAPVPLPEGGYLKGDQGNIVVPVPDFNALRQVAAKGGGQYYDLEAPESTFRTLNQTAVLFPKKEKKSELTGDQWLDRGPWLLLPLVFMAAFCFRRGWLLIILGTLLFHPAPAAAFNWHDLWQRPDQQAATAFQQKDYKEAAQLAKDSAWQAAALYRAGKFKQAAAALKPLNSASDHYNRGNALARAGELEKALAAYDQALKLDPQMEDARFNRELVKKLLKQQQQQQKKNESRKNDSKQQNKQQNNKNNEEQQQQQQRQGNQTAKDNSSAPQDLNRDKQSTDRQNQEEKERQSSADQTGKDQEDQKTAPAEQSAHKQQQSENEKEQKNKSSSATTDEKPMDAKQQALKQWLRRVPDDPGGLLERKFFYQYRARQGRSQGHKGW
ncbi:MAG: VWA domain-containing protein [Pseudomonadota bacterium]|nr:VWA domain-containing protein [Pseudomonadota bacterium]